MGFPTGLSSDVLTEILRFALESMCDWSKLQRVSKQWQKCCRKPRTLEFLTPRLDDLERLGVLCSIVRSVEHVVSEPSHLTNWSDTRALKLVPLLDSLFLNGRLIDWSLLPQSGQLRTLHIWNSNQTLDELFVPSRCGALRDLEIHDCPRFNGRNLSLLDNLKRLKRLSLQKIRVGSRHLDTLSLLPRLRHLYLDHCDVRSLDWLAPLTKLRTLSLNGSQFLADLEPLCGLIHLRTLHLDQCWTLRFDGEQLDHLSSMWQLEVLSASEWFSNRGLELLMQWKRLRRVCVPKCKFDPALKKKFVGWCTRNKIAYVL